MKSTTSSVVSDGDTMEAAATINTNVTTSTKDQLDLASDFPPLLSSIVDRGSGPEPPKWVTKNDSQNITSTSSSSSSGFFPDSGSSSSAVIDASDDSNKNQQIGPPPDVTVGANCQQCTAGLPDVAAQAPYFMNTANRYVQKYGFPPRFRIFPHFKKSTSGLPDVAAHAPFLWPLLICRYIQKS